MFLRAGPAAFLAMALSLLAAPAGWAQLAFLPEIRGGIAAHDVARPGSGLLDPARVRDVNVELLFSAPGLDGWALLGELRPHLGVTLSLAGQESLVYAGLSWTVRAPVIPVFAEIGLGGALHDGGLKGGPPRFGCAALFHGQASLGVEVLPRTALMATVQHATDAGLCGVADDPLTIAGLRLGIRF